MLTYTLTRRIPIYYSFQTLYGHLDRGNFTAPMGLPFNAISPGLPSDCTNADIIITCGYCSIDTKKSLFGKEKNVKV